MKDAPVLLVGGNLFSSSPTLNSPRALVVVRCQVECRPVREKRSKRTALRTGQAVEFSRGCVVYVLVGFDVMRAFEGKKSSDFPIEPRPVVSSWPSRFGLLEGLACLTHSLSALFALIGTANWRRSCRCRNSRLGQACLARAWRRSRGDQAGPAGDKRRRRIISPSSSDDFLSGAVVVSPRACES